jgi:hypothetical protein
MIPNPRRISDLVQAAGQAETAKQKAAIKAYKGPSEDGMGTLDSPSPLTGSTGERAPAKAAAKKPAEAPIVTQGSNSRHLALTNLRDYLNESSVASSAVLKKTQKVKQLQVCHVKHGE